MKSKMSMYYLPLLLLVAKPGIIASLVQHITSTPQCLVESCVTLSQFAVNSSTQQGSNITLVLSLGNHHLDQSISLANLNEFRLQTSDGLHAEIMCDESANISLYHINHVHIGGVKFIGCQGSRFDSISQVLLENLTFTSHYSNGAALQLVEIGSVHIFGSFFISNTAGSYRSNTEFLEYLKSGDPNYNNINTHAKIGGALITTHSNVYITECLFIGNSAEVGGSIYSELNSNVTIRNCNFTQNYADHNDIPKSGGVMVINSGCTVTIHGSVFLNNTKSGVIFLLSAIAYVRETIFAENRCAGSGGVFTIYDSTLVVENSTFHKNAAQIFGGAIHAVKTSTINVTEAVFDQNEATYGGALNVKTQSKVRISNSVLTSNKGTQFGGIMLMREGSILTIDNSTLESNTAMYGGVIFEIYSTITVQHSTFYNNTAYNYGGVISGSFAGGSNITLNDSVFLSNRAGVYGGVVVVYNNRLTVFNNVFNLNTAAMFGGVVYGRSGSTVSIENSKITHNVANTGIFFIDKSTITVNTSIFESNNATLAGGFMYISHSNLEAFNSNFVNNMATEGGAFYTYNASVLLHNCTCSHNQAMYIGGVIMATENSTITINNSGLTSNMASNQGGVIILWNCVVTMDKSMLVNNTAMYAGGVMIIGQTIAITVNCSFINNSAETGGVIYNFKSKTTISQSFFLNNNANAGGALSIELHSHVFLNDSTFLDNVARIYGGALVVRNFSSLTTYNNIYGENFVSDERGGALYLEGQSIFTARDCEFIGNRANEGGAISMHNSTSYLSYCTFSRNRAGDDGGAVQAVYASHIDIRSSTFLSNSAPSLASFRDSTKFCNEDKCYSTGGSLLATVFSTIIIDNSTFFNNSAEYGGTIASESENNITINQCTFTHNVGLADGAVLYSEGFLVGNIMNSTFLRNRASENGGAISLYFRNEMTIDGSIFDDNSASLAGGAIYCHLVRNLIIKNSQFIGNSVGNTIPSTAVNPDQNTSMFNVCFDVSLHRGGVIFVNAVPLRISNSTFVNNSADYGGAVRATCGSTVSLKSITCRYNWALYKGGVLNAKTDSKVVVESSLFDNNLANEAGGVISADLEVTIIMADSTFTNNFANVGGTLHSVSSNITISNSKFLNNTALIGVVDLFTSKCVITDSNFTHNTVTQNGGTAVIDRGTLFIYRSVFTDNRADLGGVLYAFNASTSFSNSTCIGNRAALNGGVVYLHFKNNLTTYNTNFNNNVAGNDGGVIFSLLENTVDVIYGQFSSNRAGNDGAVFFISYQTLLTLSTSDVPTTNQNGTVFQDTECRFGLIIENNEAERGTVLFSNDFSSITLKGQASMEIKRNSGNLGGIVYLYESTLTSSTFIIFEENVESIHAEKSTVVFTGNTSFINCASSLTSDHISQDGKGGAVKSIRSDISFDGYTAFQGNTAENGAAVHAIESNVNINGETTITHNRAKVNGGGLCLIRSTAHLRGRSIFDGNHAQYGGAAYLEQSTMDIFDKSILRNNTAKDGGGFYSQTSTLSQNSDLTIVSNAAERNGGGLLAIKSNIIGGSNTQFKDNKAQLGGACSLDGNTKFYQRNKENYQSDTEPIFIFTANEADAGGALFIDDNANLALCDTNPQHQNTSAECFFYTSTPLGNATSIQNFKFSNNTARLSGADLFGGLLDRCTAKTSNEFHYHTESQLSDGLVSFQAISRKNDLESIGSHPVRVCICKDSFPNCSYQQPPIEIKSGHTFSLRLAALDQANHEINATIHSSVDSMDGGLGDGQAIQRTYEACTELTYSIYSPLESEQLAIYAEGPCNDNGISKAKIAVKIIPCLCPIGFQISTDLTDSCICSCDTVLAAYITECDHSTESVIRRGNYWLTYINTSVVSGYLVYPNCPLDYCHLPTTSIKVNLNHPYGSDAQCTSNKAGLLCGACQEGLSLSLGSSRCIPCPRYWPVLMIAILIAAFLAGISLVASLLVLNLTVAAGTINALIFYANIVGAYKSTFFPSSTVSFASIIISWLNLELGFNVCFFQGMDKYAKTWLQFAFPMYVIFLVGAIIFTSQRSTRFSQLVGKKNPVATLATLILLSYAKFLQTIITALSFATLEYPDSSKKTVWLPDATVQYFYGKHSILLLIAVAILFVGILFTALLFLWQWILRLPDVRYIRFIRHHKLQLFMESYSAPYNQDYRYWTGLLLLLRVVLYFVAAVNVSGDPRVTHLTLLFTLGGLMTGKWMLKVSLNKKWHNDFLEGITHVNLLIFTAFSWYTFETGKNQSIVAHVSVAVTLILLLAVIFHHIRTNTNLLTTIANIKNYKFSRKAKKVASESDESRERLRRTSTFSVVEVPRYDDDYPSTIPEESEGLANIEFHEQDIEITESCFVNPLYIETREDMEANVEVRETMLTDRKQANLILDELAR